MTFRNTVERFGSVAKTFHWLTFFLLIGLFSLGAMLLDLPLSPRKLQVYSWHKWIGTTVFLLTVLRIGWRFLNPVPRQPPDQPPWIRRLASISHAALYTMLIVMPLTGWVMSSALNLPLVYFGLIYLPSPFGVNAELGQVLRVVHGGLALTLLALITVHVIAAIYHHVVLRDDILRRMLPWMRNSRMSDT